MVTYTEILIFQRTFRDFMNKIMGRKQAEVQFYLKGRIKGYVGYSFIGYTTNRDGLHGLHYSLQANTFRFGTYCESNGNHTQVLYMKTPAKIKDSMIDVSTSRKSKQLVLKER